MQFIESISHIVKEDSYAISNTYNNVISNLLYKISCTVNSVEYAEFRVIGLEWCKDHGSDFIEYENVTQEIMMQWAKNILSSEEILNMEYNLHNRVEFGIRTTIEV